MKYAVIDIGTNSCRLLIAELVNNKICPIYRTLITTRLGENIKDTTLLSDAALNRTVDALNEFHNIMKSYEVNSYRAIATSAVREADNKAEFVRIVQAKCNINVDVISGEEEAFLSYLGVKHSLELEQAPVVIDLGGGSTEIIYEDKFFSSIPIGAVKVLEYNCSAYDIKDAFKILVDKKTDFNLNPLSFVGGTATSLVALKYAMEEYDANLVHGQVLTRSEIVDLYNMLEMTPLSLRKRLPGLQPERADIITGGTLIMLIIMDILGKGEIVVSGSDLMEGVVLTLEARS